jgi:hypothetical protein
LRTPGHMACDQIVTIIFFLEKISKKEL